MFPPSQDIDYDPDKARLNWHKHRVRFSHAEAVLRDPQAITIEDPDAQDEQRYITLGMDALGRVLVVVHTPRGDTTRIISARKASPREGESYAR